MNILFIAPLNSIHTKRWVEYFAAQPGVHVRVVSLSSIELEIRGATVHELRAEDSSSVRLVRMVSRYVSIKRTVREIQKQFQPDVIHIHAFKPLAYVVAKLFHAPIVATPWGSDIVHLPRTSVVKRWAARRLAREAAVLTCDAVHMKQRLVELGASRERIELVYFGTNVKEYTPNNRDERLSATLFDEAKARLVVSTRALNPLYDVGTLVRAIPSVVGKVPLARFVIVGGGSQKEALEELSRELMVQDYVRFTGRLSDDDLRRCVASADVYVSTALSDGGLAASTAEAMASGVPVIVTDFGDNDEWLDGESAGLTFPASDHQELSNRIVGLLENDARRKSMGHRARALIVEKNNYEREMQKMLSIYRRTASTSRLCGRS